MAMLTMRKGSTPEQWPSSIKRSGFHVQWDQPARGEAWTLRARLVVLLKAARLHAWLCPDCVLDAQHAPLHAARGT